VGRTDRRPHLTVYTTMNRVDSVRGVLHLVSRPERQTQHRADGLARALDIFPGAAAKITVLGHTCRDQRMRHLEKDGPSPPEHHKQLFVDTPDHLVGRRRFVVGGHSPVFWETLV